MPTASGLTLRHLAGPTSGSEMPLHAGSRTLANEHGAAALTISAAAGERASVLIAATDGAVLLDRHTLDGAVEWRPGAVVRIGPDAWMLDDGDSTVPLDDDRAVLVGRVAGDAHSSGSSEPDHVGVVGHLLAAPWWPAAIVSGAVLGAGVHPGWWALSALAAVLLVVTYVQRRRRDRRHAAEQSDDRRRAAERFEAELGRHEARRVARARRRPARPGEVVLGVGDRPWRPSVDGADRAGWDPEPILQATTELVSVPARADLHRGALAIVGDPAIGRGVARSIVRQLTDAGHVDAVAAPPSSAWRWAVGTPLFTARPDRFARDRVAVLSETVPSARAAHRPEGPTIVVTPTLDDAERHRFATVLDLDATGCGELHHGDRLAASNVSASQLSEAAFLGRPTVDAVSEGERGLLLFSAPALPAANELLASLVIDLARRAEPDALAIRVIDAVDRPLVRLRQLPHVDDYTSLDDGDGVAALLAAADRSADRQLVIVVDLPEADRHLRRTDPEAARTLLRLSVATDHAGLTVAGSRAAADAVDLPLAAAVGPSVERLNGDAVVTDDGGRRVITLPTPSARDLTAAVAGIRRRLGY